MGLTVRTRNEVQFVELLARTRALDNDSWRKPHFYEHLKKLHAQLSKILLSGCLCIIKGWGCSTDNDHDTLEFAPWSVVKIEMLSSIL